MAFCNCRKKFAAQEQYCVTEETPVQNAGGQVAPPRLEQLAKLLPGVHRSATLLGETVLWAEPDSLPMLMQILRDDPRFRFEQLVDLCGVDWPERPARFEVVYNLLSVSLNQRIRVIVAADEQTPVPSVHMVWPAATWWEREAWDLFGIVFAGQPDLRRILTDYGFDGHPMRKDFPLTGYVEVRYDEDRKELVHEPVRLTQDFRRFDFLSPWEAMTSLPGDEKAHAQYQARAADIEKGDAP